MKYLEKHPMIMIVIGIMGISLSAIFVRYSQAPSVVTAAYRLLWTVSLMAPVVFLSGSRREELFSTDKKTALLCAVSGIFLALHFVLWFESLRHTSVASSTWPLSLPWPEVCSLPGQILPQRETIFTETFWPCWLPSWLLFTL